MSNKFRAMAERFQVDGGSSLGLLMKGLERALDEFPADKADAVEAMLVDHLENSLNDIFGLEQGIEAAYLQAEEEEAEDLERAAGCDHGAPPEVIEKAQAPWEPEFASEAEWKASRWGSEGEPND